MNVRLVVVVAIGALCCSATSWAQPSISNASPGAVAPGQPVEVTFTGDKLTGPIKLWTSFAAKIEAIEPAKDQKSLKCKITVDGSAPIGVGGVIVANAAGVSEALLMMVDDLPSVADKGSNHAVAQAQPAALPVAIDGASNGVSFDYYRFAAKKGQPISAEVVARRLNSSMDPVVRLLDPRGQEMLLADDDAGLGADCRFRATAPEDGEYTIEIRDNQYKAGGRYRLRIGDFPLITSALPLGGRLGSTAQFKFVGPAADDAAPMIVRLPAASLTGRVGVTVKRTGGQASAFGVIAASDLPEAVEGEKSNRVTLPCAVNGVIAKPNEKDVFEFVAAKGQRIDLRPKSRSFGSPSYVFLRVLDAAGKAIGTTTVNNNEEFPLAVTAPADGVYRLEVRDLLHRGGPEFAYRVEVRSAPDFSLTLKNDKATKYRFVAARGDGVAGVVVQCGRTGYDGPIELSLESDETGLELYNATIPAKATEHRLFISVPPTFQEADFHALRIVGSAKIGGQDVERLMSSEPTIRARMPNLLYPYGWQDGLVSVTTGAPAKAFYGLKTEAKEFAVARGVGTAEIKFTLERLDKEFKAGVNIYHDPLPAGFSLAVKAEKDVYTATLTGGKDAAEANFPVRLVAIAEHKGRGQKVVVNMPTRVFSPPAEKAAAK
ncbi:MAG: PPC domain-containing protein [Pirellulaceae bacterium]|jgi:hypothetical protein|nr:PPC domain-containing protein [Pirellulaceae bacterium]MDP7016795.1 PPC domain-containing protein [Pirellulaceae bacterium]